ncbi:MAG: 50S ribosomal protein L35 [Mycoplasmataceae bacterium]|nr:50S ribosomal protein L35 [Mycoplasmataceae bacterium]
MKTRKAVVKRFKVSATGKIICKHTNRSHRAYGKTTKQKRHLRGDKVVSASSRKLISRGLMYKF